jgi:N12 class adenine-specific DNA methylase
MATWDCIIITHSAFKFLPAPAEFERRLIQQEINGYSELLEKVDGNDRISRKRIENMKEKLEAKFDALQSRKDDLLTIGEIGIDQIIVDEAQEFRKLSFPTNMTSPRASTRTVRNALGISSSNPATRRKRTLDAL